MKIELNGVKTCMEIDTGATATNISENTVNEIRQGKLEVKPATDKLRTYTGESVKVVGTVNIMVNYEKQKGVISPYCRGI